MASSSSSSHENGGAYQPPLLAYITRRLILEEVSAQTGLAHKYNSVTDENGLVKARVVVDVPQIPGRPQEKTRAFYGDLKGDLDSALESAAEVALRHLCEEFDIDINDCNYSAFVESSETLLVAQETRRKMDAKLEALEKGVIHQTQQTDKLAQKVKDICLQFGHLLPVRAGPNGVEYVGPPSPTGGYDKVAFDLVQLLQDECVE